MHLELTAAVQGSVMVPRMRDGIRHSRWSIAAEDPIEALERLEAGREIPPRPWSLEALDASLEREDYRRISEWHAGEGGPACRITR